MVRDVAQYLLLRDEVLKDRGEKDFCVCFGRFTNKNQGSDTVQNPYERMASIDILQILIYP